MSYESKSTRQVSRRTTNCLAALLLAAAPSLALAGGYHWPDLGTAALARGGAFVARADDPTAIYYNPAGAARIQGTQLLLNGHVLIQRQSFRRRQYSDAGVPPQHYSGPAELQAKTMPRVENDDGPSFNPFFAVTSDLGGLLRPHRLVLLAGVYGPNAHPSVSYPRFCRPGSDPCEPADAGDPAPQRYDTVKTEIFVIYPSVGLAWQPLDGLSIGGVFQLGYATLGYETVVGAQRSENPATDFDVRLDNESDLTPTGIVGLHWRALPFVELGASLRFGFSFHTEGEVCIGERAADGRCAIPDDFGLPVRLINPVGATLEIPKAWIARVGVRYVDRDALGRERFDVELDFVWETTSTLERFDLLLDEPIDVYFGESDIALTTVEALPLDHGWHDSWSLRLGGSYRIHDLFDQGRLVMRAGTLYQSSPMPDSFTRLDFQREVDPATGEACARRTSVDCGSQVRKIVPLIPGDPADKFGNPVGNGSYDAAIDQISIGATVVFGRP
jgi:long-chain fatty acid transport protein